MQLLHPRPSELFAKIVFADNDSMEAVTCSQIDFCYISNNTSNANMQF